MKPKTPCPPGFCPVIIEDHATEETSGMEDCIFLNIACEISSAVFGMTPVSVNSLSMPKGTPSRPTITVLAFFVMVSVHNGDYSAGTDVLILNKHEASQFLNIVEVFDGHWFFGFDDDLRNLKILDYAGVFLDNLEC